MSIFEEITLEWKGQSYVIAPENVMRAIAKIEDVISMVQIARYFEKGDLPLVKISQAYAAALRHAGARVSDEDVYGALFSGGELQLRAVQALQTLQMMMIPPVHLRQDKAAEKKAEATGKRAASSRKPTSS